MVLESLRDLGDDFLDTQIEGSDEIECITSPMFTGSSSVVYHRFSVEPEDEIPHQVENINEALSTHGYVLDRQTGSRPLDALDLEDQADIDIRPFIFEYSHPNRVAFPEVTYSGERGAYIEVTFYSDCFRPE